jgi:AcrR family transcriptional regulator
VSETAAIGRRYAGKTLADRRSDQRERILLAARDVFAARGYANAGIDEIVARARVSRTTFYALFENKEQCLLAVYRMGLEQIGAEVTRAESRTAAADLSPRALVRAEVRATLAAYAADPALARVLLIEIVGATPAAERAQMRARSVAALIIQRRMEAYGYWRERSVEHRRVASIGAMAAIGETIRDLVMTERLGDWEELEEPLSEFIGRALIDPAEPS